MPDTPSPWTAPDLLPLPIEGPRVRLRLWEDGDAAELFSIIDTHRAALLEFLPWPDATHANVSESLAFVRRMGEEADADPLTNLVLAIVDRASGEVLGGTGLHRAEAAAHTAEIGYWVRPDRWGRGHCTESTRHLLSAAFRPQEADGFGLRRIVVVAAAANVASCRVPEKLGLRLEARRVQARWERGRGWSDDRQWAVLAHEWDADAHRMR